MEEKAKEPNSARAPEVRSDFVEVMLSYKTGSVSDC
jgi:hypothetical protein